MQEIVSDQWFLQAEFSPESFYFVIYFGVQSPIFVFGDSPVYLVFPQALRSC